MLDEFVLQVFLGKETINIVEQIIDFLDLQAKFN